MSLSAQCTVGSIVAEHPAAARVLEQFGIDYCCGGKRPLADACVARALDPERVVAEIRRACASGGQERSWIGENMDALASNIERTHHAYLRTELPRLGAILNKVADVHGERHPEMVEAARVFEGLAAEMQDHMADEEEVLFPALRRLEAGQGLAGAAEVAPKIEEMLREHDDAGAALARLRELTDGYTPPAGACTTFRVALASLAELERDMHQHVHKENNILFPAALRAVQAAR
jgi:regulator of cell morphogenesis and NO signaling